MQGSFFVEVGLHLRMIGLAILGRLMQKQNWKFWVLLQKIYALLSLQIHYLLPMMGEIFIRDIWKNFQEALDAEGCFEGFSEDGLVRMNDEKGASVRIGDYFGQQWKLDFHWITWVNPEIIVEGCLFFPFVVSVGYSGLWFTCAIVFLTLLQR
ncbi:hypothetical protein ACJX0J_040187 [Zea mays]